MSLQNDANCDCYQTGDGYAKDARLNGPSSLVAAPDGTLYVADLGNIRIRAVRRNQPPTSREPQSTNTLCTLERLDRIALLKEAERPSVQMGFNDICSILL